MPAKTLMVQGTASNVGKSIITAALCRILKRKGYRVAPFKAQNMSNNSFATKDGGEVSRAQAEQAAACELEPTIAMNPVLLKPTTDQGAQVVVMGKPIGTMTAKEYQAYKPKLLPIVRGALNQLMKSFDVVVIEGAGSPAEINIKHEIVNMAVARMVKAPVILVGDIDKGGIFAQFLGTFNLLKSSDQKLVCGFLVNKFRGDKKILDPGLKWLERQTKRKVLGVVPFIPDLDIAEEDSVALEKTSNIGLAQAETLLKVDVIRLPKISNFTDFDALKKERDVALNFLQKPNRNYLPDLIILPGSKSTISDLKFLWDSGFVAYIKKCVMRGVPIIGICGGYQMMGEKVLDPEHVEAEESECFGLGLLPTVTVFQKEKITCQVKAIHLESQMEIAGYEIHMGRTENHNGSQPFLKIKERNGVLSESDDGVMIENTTSGGRSFIYGTYLHGLFDNAPFRRFFLNKIRRIGELEILSDHASQEQQIENSFDVLADSVENHIDMKFLLGILEGKK